MAQRSVAVPRLLLLMLTVPGTAPWLMMPRNELTAPVWLTELAIFLIVLAVMFSGAPVAELTMPVMAPVVAVVVEVSMPALESGPPATPVVVM